MCFFWSWCRCLRPCPHLSLTVLPFSPLSIASTSLTAMPSTAVLSTFVMTSPMWIMPGHTHSKVAHGSERGPHCPRRRPGDRKRRAVGLNTEDFAVGSSEIPEHRLFQGIPRGNFGRQLRSPLAAAVPLVDISRTTMPLAPIFRDSPTPALIFR